MMRDSFSQFDYSDWQAEGMTEDEARGYHEEQVRSWESYWTKKLRAEHVSGWFTATFGAFIVLASFVLVFVVAMPLLDMWALVPSTAYIIGFFAMLAEEKASGFT